MKNAICTMITTKQIDMIIVMIVTYILHIANQSELINIHPVTIRLCYRIILLVIQPLEISPETCTTPLSGFFCSIILKQLPDTTIHT